MAARVPEELEDGRASWAGASDGAIRLTAGEQLFMLTMPGLEASDLEWVDAGEPVVVLRGDGAGSVTLRREGGRFIFQSRVNLGPERDTTPSAPILETDEGLTVEARPRSEATCREAIPDCWGVALTGPMLTFDGTPMGATANVGETGRTTVDERGFAFRGTYHLRLQLWEEVCQDLGLVGEGASWLVATSA